jgi:hypothetical protein
LVISDLPYSLNLQYSQASTIYYITPSLFGFPKPMAVIWVALALISWMMATTRSTNSNADQQLSHTATITTTSTINISTDTNVGTMNSTAIVNPIYVGYNPDNPRVTTIVIDSNR